MDAYYCDLHHLSKVERERVNFDDPGAIDIHLFLTHLRALRRGMDVAVPRYDFSEHVRCDETDVLVAGAVLLVEGLHVGHWPELRAELDLLVYVDLELEQCLARRIQRDVAERGRDARGVCEQYARWVRPMAERYVLPVKATAELVVRGDAALEAVVGEMMSRMEI